MSDQDQKQEDTKREPTAEPVTEPVTESTTEPATEPTTEPVKETTTEPSAEPVKETTTEPAAESATEPTAETKTDLTEPTETKTEPSVESTGKDKKTETTEEDPAQENSDKTDENRAEDETSENKEAENNEDNDEDLNDSKTSQKEHSNKRKVEEVPVLPEDFYYDYESLIFKPIISEESNASPDLLKIFHSFGYDCKKRFNLNLIDSDTLIFSAGNLVQILNVNTKEQKYLKTTSGGAVGAIRVHPSCKYFAVGEKGNYPNINIYEYPSLKLYRILRKGTVKGYAYLDFDPDGDLIASVGQSPDYMLTVWDWKKELVVLRTKAFAQDIFKCTFSKDLKGTITTSGTGHIKFWKMASTFTGYKLQGDLGKFGKTEITDIEGYAELPDGKVLSGSEWGNMLLWDGGLIQTEICRRKNKACHTASIHQITLDDGDIYTISDDGIVRVWDFETIDTAEPSEEGVKLEIEPLNELKVGNNVALNSMVKDIADESTIWFAQDGNGGIWRLDLSFSASSENPKQLFSYHAGVINGIGCCPNSHFFATTADDGSIKVYDYLTYDIIAQARFKNSGTSLKWLSSIIDPDGATICVGYSDGLLRFLKLHPNDMYGKDKNAKTPYDLVLFEIFKPHTKPITKLSINNSGSIIVTGSTDKTLFFFANQNNARTPIGFVNLPSPITYMTWAPREYAKSCLLVCMEDGSVFEYEEPVQGKYDTTKTYLIEMSLKCRKYKFKSIKSRLRHEEELERIRIEEQEKHDKENTERKARGLPTIEEEEAKKKAKKQKKEEGAEGDEEKPAEPEIEEEEVRQESEEDKWKPYYPETPSKICWALYSSPDTFWVSMDAYDAGYLYECKFVSDIEKSKMSMTLIEKLDEPFNSIAVKQSDLTHTDDIPLSCMIQDKFKKNLIIGEKNGALRIQPMADSRKVQDSNEYWSYGYHDTDYGTVTNIELSYNEKFMFSTGQDSNIFGILFNCGAEELEKAKADKPGLGTSEKIKEIADIDDPMAYSIEEAKQKSESDKILAIAEKKKTQMRQKITDLRKTFKGLIGQNDSLVPRLKLNKDEFALEQSIKDQVIGQINEKIDTTHKELAWQSERCRIMVEKLKIKYKDMIDCDYIVLYTFDQLQEVSSFRTVALPRDMENYKNELEKQYLAKLAEKQKGQNNQENSTMLDNQSTMDDMGTQGLSASDQMKKIFGKLRGATAQRIERALRKMDERKLKRLKRKKEWRVLLSSKLPDDYENPVDVANIKNAEDNLGDFKLKSSKDFIVPEEQRMNVYKAVERLMKIKEFLHDNQMLFNNDLKSLRNKKISLVDEINKGLDRLEQISFILVESDSVDGTPSRPRLKLEEIPEKKYEHTRETLLEFKKELELKALNNTKEGEEDGGGFGGGFGGGGAAGKSQSAKKHSDQQKNSEEAKKIANLSGLKPLWANKESMTSLMKKTVKSNEIKLRFEQNRLVRDLQEKIEIFNAELKVLRHEKARISVLMKNADLRHVTIFEEFLLLRDFEKTENILESKNIERKEGHVELQHQLKDCQRKIDLKRKDLENLDLKQKQLMESYNQLTHDELKYPDFLLKVFKRKIKRKKKVEGEEEDEDSEDEDEDESEDDDDDDDDEDDDDSEAGEREQLDLDICPSALRQELFDQVCQLREKKLDIEEAVQEEKKLLDQYRKDLDSLVKKARLADNELKKTKKELEDFQKEKQKKINDLDIVVTMRLNQLQYLEDGRLPNDLSQALAFDSQNLGSLQVRIKELQTEKAQEKKMFKNLKEHHHELIRDKKKMDEYVGKLDKICNKMMSDKFGKVVDLEKLELIVVNQQVEELKQRMLENGNDHEKAMQDWLNKINNEKDEAVDVLKANTTRLNEMVDVLNETKRLETVLDNKQSSLGEEMAGSSKKDIEERQRLHTLVQLQAQEVEALKAEIAILSRKGGHILPPTQPPANTQIQSN